MTTSRSKCTTPVLQASVSVAARNRLTKASALVLLAGSMGMLPMAAHATAYGISYWGGFGITVGGQGIKVPAGQLFGAVEGSGLRINTTGGDFLTYTGSICNWHIQVDFIDQNGAKYAWYRQPDQQRCNAAGIYKVNAGGWQAKPGKACIRLYTNFREHVASVCHSIHR